MLNLIFATVSILFIFISASYVFAEEVSWTGCEITKKAFMSEIAKEYDVKTGFKIILSGGGGATKGIRTASTGTSNLGGACEHWLIDTSGTKHSEEINANLTLVARDVIVAITIRTTPWKIFKNIASGKYPFLHNIRRSTNELS